MVRVGEIVELGVDVRELVMVTVGVTVAVIEAVCVNV